MKSKKDFNFSGGKNHAGASIFLDEKIHTGIVNFHLRPLREERRRRIELRARCC
jgi:hypothetical protein